MNTLVRTAVAALALGAMAMGGAAPALAQETGIQVRSIRVLATDVEKLAVFYETAFGMSETRRPVDTATFKEIVINSGATAELAKASKATPIVIATRGKDMPAGAMAALILGVPDMDKAIERATKAGAKLMRPVAKSGEGLSYAFLTDPDGNQIELLLTQ